MRSIFWILLLAMSTNGCARVEVRPVEPDDVKGVRFYRPYPYLWITAADKGGCQMSITYLPQMKQEYIIIPHTGIGSVKMAPTLTNGWALTALDTAADSKASEMVTAIGGLVGNVAKAAAGGANFVPNVPEFGPGLYKIEFDAAGYINNLNAIFLQKGQNNFPTKCADVKPPLEPQPPRENPR